MKIVFLRSATPDLRWFKRYYMTAFPEGRRNADQHFQAILSLLLSSPLIGGPVDDFQNAREHPIQKTPFSVIYRVKGERIEILRILDQRSGYANERRKPEL